MAGAPATPHNRPPKLTTAEARQGTGPRAMLWVLIGSLSLAVIAGLALGPRLRLDPTSAERHALN
jgi:hypothetical protein